MIPLGNEIYCNATSDSKTPMFPAANDVFPFPQYCMKPYGKKNLTDKEILFNYCLSRKRIGLT